MNGFHIFTDSKPVMPYDSLGVVGLGFVSSTQYEAIRKNLIKRARERFPDANGLILKLDKNGLDNATVVKFQ